MNNKDFIRLGVPLGEATRRATDFISKFILAGGDKTRLEEEVKAIVANPSAFAEDSLRGEFAKALRNAPPPPRAEPIKYRQWGEGLEHEAVMQMERACLLPVAVAGALMPDAHVGYGLPIGGVLATENTVIPYAVGVDIACRMKMTVLDMPARDLEHHQDRLTRAIEAETRFGIGASFKHRRQHEVLDADWNVSPVTKQNKDRARSQLGTSGSGNHFVEFGRSLAADFAMGHGGAGTEDGQPGPAPADDFRRENREGLQDPSRDPCGDPLRASQAQSQRTRAQGSQGLPGGPASPGASSSAQSRRPLSQVPQGQTLPVLDPSPAGSHCGSAHLPGDGL